MDILEDNIFECIFLKGNFGILKHISLKFLSKGPNDNRSALVQVMALVLNRL